MSARDAIVGRAVLCAALLIVTCATSASRPQALLRAAQTVTAPRTAPAGSPDAARARPIQYRLTFPEPQHRWMQVEVVFRDLGEAPLHARMSRSSPGRYALHEFAKNVFDLRAYGEGGSEIPVTRPDPYSWEASGHGGAVRLVYKVYGDRVDGTYLAVDTTHAHINMPAALMWGRGMDRRAVEVRFEPPAGTFWKVATQLFPTSDPHVFTAPNLQYLMDSPAEVSAFDLRQVGIERPNASAAVQTPTIRIALHHQGTEAEAEAFTRDVEKLVREAHAVYREYPAYDAGTYTFLADYLPWASGDGMEHRNSTVLTMQGALANPGDRHSILAAVAHEFFHGWNVERIRPGSLEPFDFDRVNMSGELWLGEGFTSYYDALLMQRAGLAQLDTTAAEFARLINEVALSPGRRFRSAEDMSRLAPFVDAARSIDRTYWDNTFISYYTWGAAIGLGLDLSLRDRTDGRVTLDDFMRAMWQRHGRPPAEPGYVAAPYTATDARARLAEVSGDAPFADEFFRRYIQGKEIVDYERLLARAGLVLRRARRDQVSLGPLRLEYTPAGARVTAPPSIDSPAYAAGIAQDDVIVAVAGENATSAGGVANALQGRRAGEKIEVRYLRRGMPVTAAVTLEEPAEMELVPVEQSRGTLTDAARAFRQAWLGNFAASR